MIYFFSSIGWPQQCTVPSPARVTITSAPHFAHLYLFPTWFAIFSPSLTILREASLKLNLPKIGSDAKHGFRDRLNILYG